MAIGRTSKMDEMREGNEGREGIMGKYERGKRRRYGKELFIL
jgi:hypothetical protein